MAQSSLNRWKFDPEYIDLLNYFIEITKDAKSPINVSKSVVDFKEKSGSSQNMTCLDHRIRRMRAIIHSFEHIDTKTKVKLLFAMSAPVDAGFLKELKKNARVEVDNKKRITKYEAKDGSLRLQKGQNRSARLKTTKLAPKRSLRSSVTGWSFPKNEEVKEMGNLMKFIKEMCENVDTPLNISLLTNEFNKKFGLSRSLLCIQTRVTSYCREIQKTELLDTHSTVKQLFGLSAKLELDYLENLRKDAVVEVDDLNRITKYEANDGRLVLNQDPSSSAKKSMDWLGRKKSKTTVEKQCNSGGNEKSEKENDHPENDGKFDSDEENDHLDETEDHIEPSNEAVDFYNKSPAKNPSEMSIGDNFDYDIPTERTLRPEEIESSEDQEKDNDPEITVNASVKTRYGRLSKKRHLNSEFSYNLAKSRKSANPSSTGLSSSKPAKQKKIAIEKEQTSSSSNQSTSSSRPVRRTIGRSPSPSISTEGRIEWKKKINAVKKHVHSGGDKDDESEKGNDHSETDNDDFSIDNAIDFDPLTERPHRSEEFEMRDDVDTNSGITGNAAVETQKLETLPNSKTSSSTTHTPKSSKRKADASTGSNSSKHPRPPSDESMNPGEVNDNISHVDPSRVELNPVRGPLGLPNETQKHSDVQQIPKPPLDVIVVPIKKEYEEEAQTSLKMVLKSFKSLILGLGTTGLSQLQMELDTKIERTGRGVEISNKEVIMAMDFLVVKLSKHGALKSSEEAFSLHDILLILRSIILNSSFKGLEDILKMLKENIDQLKNLDKKVPVSKVDSVLRTTVDSIST